MKDNKSPNGSPNRKWMYFGALGLTLLTKYKTIVPLLAKVAVPVFTMLASILAYAWATRSWGIAIGLVVMIFIHEIGHVLAAKQRGIPVSMPVFIPFLGALIMMKRNPRDAVTEAYVAIGGPVLGTIGALGAYLLGVALENTMLLVVAYMGFFINLINLLPIHPLDGGRISAAVTRWLWLVGLVVGFFVILNLEGSGKILFLIIWALFAFELYTKYVSKRKKRSNVNSFQIQIPIEYIRLHGVFVPGEQHQRELDFVTYSNLDRNQIIEVYWDSMGIREKMTFDNQFLVHAIRVVRLKHNHGSKGELTGVVASCEIAGSPFMSDRYYEVKKSTRINFGIAYVGLAAFLTFMLLSIHAMDIPGVR